MQDLLLAEKRIKIGPLLQSQECQLCVHASLVIHVVHGVGLMVLVTGPFNALTMYAQFALWCN